MTSPTSCTNFTKIFCILKSMVMTSCDKQIKSINTEVISNNSLFTHKLVDSVDLDLFCSTFCSITTISVNDINTRLVRTVQYKAWQVVKQFNCRKWEPSRLHMEARHNILKAWLQQHSPVAPMLTWSNNRRLQVVTLRTARTGRMWKKPLRESHVQVRPKVRQVTNPNRLKESRGTSGRNPPSTTTHRPETRYQQRSHQCSNRGSQPLPHPDCPPRPRGGNSTGPYWLH